MSEHEDDDLDEYGLNAESRAPTTPGTKWSKEHERVRAIVEAARDAGLPVISVPNLHELVSRFGVHQRVVTTVNHAFDREYVAEVRATRKDGTGRVIAVHDSHGLCYDVKLDDGTTSSYESSELRVERKGP